MPTLTPLATLRSMTGGNEEDELDNWVFTILYNFLGILALAIIYCICRFYSRESEPDFKGQNIELPSRWSSSNIQDD